MQTYLVRRCGIAATASGLDAALTRLRSAESDLPTARTRWLRSYALREVDGRFGLACLFEAEDAGALELHAERTRLPAHEVLPVVASAFARPFAPTMVYLVRRRAFCGSTAELVRRAAASHRLAGETMARDVSWLRTYSVAEREGGDRAEGARADGAEPAFGTMCLYQAIHGEALREHARRAGVPADEVTAVIGRVVFRDDVRERVPGTLTLVA